MVKPHVPLSYAAGRVVARSGVAVASVLVVAVLAMARLILPHHRITTFLMLGGLPLAAALGVAGAVHAKMERRQGFFVSILAIVVSGVGMIVVFGPVFGHILLPLQPATTATMTPEEGQESIEKELRRLGAASPCVRFLRGEIRRSAAVHFYYLAKIAPDETAAFKDSVISGARAAGWTVSDDHDEIVRSMPFRSQPSWFDPKAYDDVDYLSVGSDYRFVFCSKEGRVFFWWSTD